MSVSMSSVALPTCTRMLHNLSHILSKAEQFVENKKIDPTALTTFRLAPDMFTFTRQVLIACDAVKNGVARLAGVEAPKFEDNETSLAQLQERISKTLAFVSSVPASALDGTENSEFTFPAGPGKTRTLKGQDYMNNWMLPNMYFHITTAYAILRHNGVDVGKIDYLMGAEG